MSKLVKFFAIAVLIAGAFAVTPGPALAQHHGFSGGGGHWHGGGGHWRGGGWGGSWGWGPGPFWGWGGFYPYYGEPYYDGSGPAAGCMSESYATATGFRVSSGAAGESFRASPAIAGMTKARSLPLAHVDEMPGDRRGRSHGRRDEMGAALVALAAFEVAVRR